MLEYLRILILQFICMTYEVRFAAVWIVILWLSGLPGLCRVSEEGGSRPFWTFGIHLPHPLPNITTRFPTAIPITWCHNSVPTCHTHYLLSQLGSQPPHSLPTITTWFPTTTPTAHRHNLVPNHHTHCLPSQIGSQPPHPLPTVTTWFPTTTPTAYRHNTGNHSMFTYSTYRGTPDRT